MTIVIVLAIVFFIIVISVAANSSSSSSNTSGSYSASSSTSNYQQKTIDLDIPDPMVAAPEKFLDFIEKTPTKYLWQVESHLDSMNRLKDVILKEAIREKVSTEKFDKEKYLKLLEKVKSGSFQVVDSDIPEGYFFVCSIKIAGVHISGRKKYILLELEEGQSLTMKPEPYNAYDKNAIAFFHNKEHVGYVPAVDCLDVREEIRYKHKAIVADIIYKDDFIEVFVNLYRSDEQNDNPEYYLDHGTLVELRGRKIDSKFLRPKKDAEDINMFYKKKVVITGEFDRFPDRNELAEYLYESGADIDTAITERIDYVIVGKNAGWRKLERVEELGIEQFNEEEIIKILSL